MGVGVLTILVECTNFFFLRNVSNYEKINPAGYFFSACVIASNDLDLYDNQSNAFDYISLDDELTLYNREGEPSAYLKRSQNNDFDVYGDLLPFD